MIRVKLTLKSYFAFWGVHAIFLIMMARELARDYSGEAYEWMVGVWFIFGLLITPAITLVWAALYVALAQLFCGFTLSRVAAAMLVAGVIVVAFLTVTGTIVWSFDWNIVGRMTAYTFPLWISALLLFPSAYCTVMTAILKKPMRCIECATHKNDNIGGPCPACGAEK